MCNFIDTLSKILEEKNNVKIEFSIKEKEPTDIKKSMSSKTN